MNPSDYQNMRSRSPAPPRLEVPGRRERAQSVGAHPKSRSKKLVVNEADENDEEVENLTNNSCSSDFSPNNPNIQRSLSGATPHQEDVMRRKLKFFFMDPIEKYRAKKKIPWKMCLQILKVIVVTVQLCLFGYNISSHVNFLERNNVAFEHLFIYNWDPTHETMPYPAAIGIPAVYDIPKFYKMVDNALQQYDLTTQNAIGSYDFKFDVNGTKVPMMMCKTYFKVGRVSPRTGSYVFNSKPDYDCFDLHPIMNGTEIIYDTKKYLDSIHKTIKFDRLVKVELKFPLRTIHLKNFDEDSAEPDCFEFDVNILFDNSDHNGQVPIRVTSVATPFKCNGTILTENTTSKDKVRKIGLIVFDCFVILTSGLSFLLVLRSLIRAQKLKFKTVKWFKKNYGKELSVYDRLEFLNLWYVLILINDVLTVIGSVYKIMIEDKDFGNYEVCGIMLGTGNLLVWFGALRYLGFFKKYNILILTMKKAFPNVLRFLFCALVFYFGFTFCGWVILGPYHVKFRSISTASECLFSLVNGDDMFVTFSVIGANANPMIWYYSRIYLYTFISLFIYVVLSLFIAVIMDTYETIKYHYENGFPKSELMQFIDECVDDPDSHYYLAEDAGCSIWTCCFGCCKRHDPDRPNEYTSLIR